MKKGTTDPSMVPLIWSWSLEFERMIENGDRVGRGESFRSAGYSDAAVAEVVAHVSLNVLTNFFNSVAETEIDFPQAKVLAS